MAATLAGVFSNWGGTPEAVNVVIRFFEEGTDTEVAKYARVSDAGGNFTVVGCLIGTYDVGIKPQGALSRLVASQTFTDGNTTNVNFGETCFGDLQFDDWITVADLSILNGAYYNTAGDCWTYAGDWLLPDWPVGNGGVAGRGALYRQIGIGVQSIG